MQYFYGNKMPLRVLDEADFWKHQEAEHTVVIRELVDHLEPEYVDLLKQWEQAFSQTEGLVRRYLETLIRSGYPVTYGFYRQIIQLVCFCLQQSQQFISFLNHLAARSKPIRTNQTAIVVLNHIRLESEYFIGVAQVIVREGYPN